MNYTEHMDVFLTGAIVVLSFILFPGGPLFSPLPAFCVCVCVCVGVHWKKGVYINVWYTSTSLGVTTAVVDSVPCLQLYRLYHYRQIVPSS